MVMKIRTGFLIAWFLIIYSIFSFFTVEAAIRFGRLLSCAAALSSYSFAP
jgi:hypothetical protein